MSHPDVAAIVLAAGKGTRFRSDTAKVLHRTAGRSLLGHVLAALEPLGLGQVVVVVGHQADAVAAEAGAAGGAGVTTARQHRQHGTGHAAAVGLGAVDDGIGQVLVVPGDAPLVTPGALEGLLAAGGEGAALLTTERDDPTGYGRVLRDREGAVTGIVEEADATPEQREVREVNAGMYVFRRERLARALEQVDDDNAQGERYLTDAVGVLADGGRRVAAHTAAATTTTGVNDRAQLARAGRLLRRRHLDRLMREVGVTVIDPATTYVDVTARVGRDTVVHPGCRLRGDTRVGERVELGPDADLTDTLVEDGARVRHAVCDHASVGPGATVGPYTHLRPGTRLERGAKAGGFVEVKAARLGEDAKAPHLAYVGDAEVGAGVNFSCGAVTVNYDGYDKHRTVVGEDAFIGCDTMLVAPVTVGAGAMTAAGSTITDDVPPGALAIARSRQTVKEGWAADRRRARRGDAADG